MRNVGGLDQGISSGEGSGRGGHFQDIFLKAVSRVDKLDVECKQGRVPSPCEDRDFSHLFSYSPTTKTQC